MSVQSVQNGVQNDLLHGCAECGVQQTPLRGRSVFAHHDSCNTTVRGCFAHCTATRGIGMRCGAYTPGKESFAHGNNMPWYNLPTGTIYLGNYYLVIFCLGSP
jgi:hypothetical protein